MNYKSLVGYEISRMIAEGIMDWHAEDGRWHSATGGKTNFLTARAIMDLPSHHYWRPDRDYGQGMMVIRRLHEDFEAVHEYEHGRGKITCIIWNKDVRVKSQETWDLDVGNEVLCDAALSFWQAAHKKTNSEANGG